MNRELALDHAAGRIDDKTYLAQIAVLREERRGSFRRASGHGHRTGQDGRKAAGTSREMSQRHAGGQSGAAATRSTEAYSLGLALALPERVQPAQEWLLARPTGVGRAITTYSMPIEGRDEWLAAAARHFA
jgi:hypothetical protein